MAFAVAKFGRSVPFYDDWDMIPLIQKFHAHTLSFSDLWAQHNVHRILFPNIVLVLTAVATRWNLRSAALLSVLCSLSSSLVFWLWIRQKLDRTGSRVVAAVLTAAWFYSPVQVDNWMSQWQIEWFMCIAASIAVIYFLDRFASDENDKPALHQLWPAVLAAVVATYSLGGGMAILPIGFCLLAAYRQRKSVLVTWAISAIVTLAIYYTNYQKVSYVDFWHQNKIDFLNYICTYLGRSVSGDQQVAQFVGSVFLALAVVTPIIVWARQKNDFNRFAPWITLMMLVIVTCLMTAYARSDGGVGQAMSPRYSAYSLLYIIGLTGVILTLIDGSSLNDRSKWLGLVTVFLISAIMLQGSYMDGLTFERMDIDRQQTLRGCLSQTNPTDACLTMIYPADINGLRRSVAYVKAEHLAGF
jgi:hypothetical protein